MKNKSNTLPKVIEDMHNGTYRYRWDISKDADSPDMDLWSYNELVIYEPVTANKITEAVINDTYGSDVENKYTNDYNAVILGVLDQSYAQKYIKFLEDRKKIKETIDAVCKECGIPNK